MEGGSEKDAALFQCILVTQAQAQAQAQAQDGM